MHALRNIMKAEATAVLGTVSQPRNARVSSYNPATPHLIKVQILPEADYPIQDGEVNETNWIPYGLTMPGNGWGIFCPPTVGDQVSIVYQQGAVNAPVAVARLADDSHLPPSGIESGEIWMLHASGSFWKFLTDGTVISSAEAGYTFTGNAVWNGNFEVNGQFSASEGAAITGAVTVTENVTAGFGGADQVTLQTHKHNDAGGSGQSGAPAAGT